MIANRGKSKGQWSSRWPLRSSLTKRLYDLDCDGTIDVHQTDKAETFSDAELNLAPRLKINLHIV